MGNKMYNIDLVLLDLSTPVIPLESSPRGRKARSSYIVRKQTVIDIYNTLVTNLNPQVQILVKGHPWAR